MNTDNAALLGSLASGLLGLWNLANIIRTGAANGRLGEPYKRTKSPGMFWMCASALILPLGISAFLAAAAFGASNLIMLVLATGALAISLILIERTVR
jgi:hypothetical protein